MLAAVTGTWVGKKSIVLMKRTQTMATMLTGFPHLPRVNGPSTKSTLDLYSWCARMTAMYERSSAGAVMLNIAVAVLTDPMAMQFRAMLKITTNQTAFTGVLVCLLTRDSRLQLTL